MLIVKKFGGSSVADKERIFNVAKDVSKIMKQEMMWSLFCPQWVRQLII